ncbi:hypothetical protein BJ912DRAFT_996551 [Pholiota molesta]|nr:hypothetical protein BJ912DRAFT_996551 [Pholiota molesta]
MGFQIDTAELSGLVVEAGFYGIMYLTLFIVSAYVFAQRQSLKIATLNLPMTITAVAMILLATAQLCVDTANVFVAFLHNDRAARIAFLADTSTKLFSAKHCILISQLLIGDSFVSYRCWIVWGRRIWIVILPVLLSLGSAVSGTYVMWVFAHHPQTTVKEQKSCLCATPLPPVTLLAFRIWQVDRKTRAVLGTSTSSLMPIWAINAAYLFIYNVTLLSGSQALEFMAQVVGLRELDWTVDHRSSIKFANGPKAKKQMIDTDPSLTTIRQQWENYDENSLKAMAII